MCVIVMLRLPILVYSCLYQNVWQRPGPLLFIVFGIGVKIKDTEIRMISLDKTCNPWASV